MENVTQLFLPVPLSHELTGDFSVQASAGVCVAANEAGLRHDFFRPAIAHTEPRAMAGITIVGALGNSQTAKLLPVKLYLR